MAIEISNESQQVLMAFAGYLVGVIAFGIFSHSFLTRSNFVKEYFIGGRGLGGWVLALTVAATAVSGGTFMGFPSLIYSNGWVMALWIASYMMVPLTAMALMGKRINQVARMSGAVTMPDVFRDRFGSPTLGIFATSLILLFLTFNLVAQFKAGGLVMKEAFQLAPPLAQLERYRVTSDARLELYFRNESGDVEKSLTPLPTTTAKLHGEPTVDIDRRQVVVEYQLADGRIVSKHIRFPAERLTLPLLGWRVEKGYLLGLLVFAFTVVAYTTYGGFWAVTWTDVFEGLVMLMGVLLMAILAVRAVPEHVGSGTTGLAAATHHLQDQDPRLVYGPGPNDFLPLGLAFSFFLMWSVTSPGQPGGMVRLMSFKDTPSLRRAMVVVGFYYFITYISLLVIFICARAIFPSEYLRDMGSEGEPDSIMPAMARKIAPSPLLAGLLLAAPYAAIMSTVAAFLLLISSSLVRDLYQRTLRPNASERSMKRLSYSITALVGVGVTIAAMNPPTFLQYIIVFTSAGQGCAFLFPMLLTLYWRRTTRQGVLAGMLGGVVTVISLYVLGWIDNRTQSDPTHPMQRWLYWIPNWGESRGDLFAPLALGGLDPVAWGLLNSLLLTIIVSWLTPIDTERANRYFPK